MIWTLNSSIDKKEMIGFIHQELDGRQELHSHEFMEIEYLLKGSVVQMINGEVYEAKEGDYFVLNVGDEHWFYTNGPAEIVNLVFYTELYDEIFTQDGFLYSKQKIKNVVNTKEEREKTATLFALMEQEYREKREGYIYVIRKFLQIILAILLRHGRNVENISDGSFMNDVAAYVAANNFNTISVDELANNCGYSRTQFYNRFKRCFGCSPLEYINRRKINMALKILANTDRPIDSIMEELDFFNKTHFYKLFLRYTGMKPNDVRKLKKTDMPTPFVSAKRADDEQ